MDWITRRYGELRLGTQILDIGCGPGDVTRRMLHAQPGVTILGVDGSEAMLDLARSLTAREGLSERVDFQRATLDELPHRTRMMPIDMVLCTSVLHHLHDPNLLWRTLGELACRTERIEAVVIDLIRPARESVVHALIERLAANEHPALKEDFFNSLCAAFTLDEVREQLRAAGQTDLTLETIDDLHLVVSGELRQVPR